MVSMGGFGGCTATGCRVFVGVCISLPVDTLIRTGLDLQPKMEDVSISGSLERMYVSWLLAPL